MARIICLDYGKKRTGVAVTDPLQLIATALDTIDTGILVPFLKDYFSKEEVSLVIIGYPLNFDDSPTDATPLVDKFLRRFPKLFPDIPILTVDERLSSYQAQQEIHRMGLSKSARSQKKLVDQIAATILLQEYLESQS